MAIALDPCLPGLQRSEQARSVLQLADGLLERLEDLQLQDQTDVPALFMESIDDVRQAAATAGLRHTQLEAGLGVTRLMDDVFDLEAELLPRCRPRTTAHTMN